MERRMIIFVLLGVTLFASTARQPQHFSPGNLKVKKVVIDPGHGGYDPGAVGKKYRESNITLAISLKLGALIKENFPDVEIIYTRQTDAFVELYRRAKIANENKADLFISIHCNASTSTTPYGTETWVMGLHKSQANLEVARLENATILLENDYSNQYDGFDPNSPEAYIIFSLFQNIFLDQSLNLAAQVQEQFEKRLGKVNRGVKQAGFLVLYKTTMPGILIETGFISNAEEELYLASEKGQEELAESVFRAFRIYKAGLEGTSVVDDKVETPEVKVTDTIETVDPPVKTVKDTLANNEDVFFRVQFSTSSTQKSTSSAEFNRLQDVRVYFHNGLYKYTTGNLRTMQDAVALQREVQQKGYRDAFVVAFHNGERITTEAAEELLKNQKK
jgi:N-acetylmuramoyl-L-alanine amidase